MAEEQLKPASKPVESLRLDGSARGRTAALPRARSHVELERVEPATHELTVFIPVRNEAHNLPGCLASLIAQSEPGFELGHQWHLYVVDDGSTDDSLSIAQAIAKTQPGLHVLSAPPLKTGRHRFTGKNAALWFGVNQPIARTAKWFLFTDADTLHEPATTHRAVVEAERHDLSMLSYSPRQIAASVLQRALLPIIFSELATTYPPKQVNDPSSPVAAANGQFLLVEREAYFSVGGHQAVADRVLEDVALARLLKRRHAIRLRYAPESVATRMYRTTGELVEGWSKNLALLFPRPLWLAASRGIDFLLLLGLPLLTFTLPWLITWQKAAIWILWLRVILRYWTRTRRSHASAVDLALAIIALPLFCVLLLRSWQQVNLAKNVSWKGREYPQ